MLIVFIKITIIHREMSFLLGICKVLKGEPTRNVVYDFNVYIVTVTSLCPLMHEVSCGL